MTVSIFPPKFQTWLETFLKEHGAAAGTVHLHVRGRLELAAAVNIAFPVRQKVRRLLRGQGMAGLALERGESVQAGDLPEPADAEGAVALPVGNGEGGVRAVVGLSFADGRELGAAELEELSAAASSVPKF